LRHHLSPRNTPRESDEVQDQGPLNLLFGFGLFQEFLPTENLIILVVPILLYNGGIKSKDIAAHHPQVFPDRSFGNAGVYAPVFLQRRRTGINQVINAPFPVGIGKAPVDGFVDILIKKKAKNLNKKSRK